MPKASKAEKAQKALEKKERKAQEAAVKAAKEKVEEGKGFLHPRPGPDGGRAPPSNYAKAGAAFDAAVELHGDNPDAYLYRGDVHRDQKMFNEAIADYARAIALFDGRCVPAFQGRATCFEAMGQWDRAIDDHSAVIDLEPQGDGAFNRRGSAMLNKKVPTIRMRNRDFEAVLEDFEQALRLNPNNYHARCNLGRLYDEHDMFSRAFDEYTKAIALCEHYSHAIYRRACCRLRAIESSRAKVEDAAFEARVACGIADHGADACPAAAAPGSGSVSGSPRPAGEKGCNADLPAAAATAAAGDPAAVVSGERAGAHERVLENQQLLHVQADLELLLPEEDPHTELPVFIRRAECLVIRGKLTDAYTAFLAATKALDAVPDFDEAVIAGTPAVVLRGIVEMRMPVLKRQMEAAGLTVHSIGSLSM